MQNRKAAQRLLPSRSFRAQSSDLILVNACSHSQNFAALRSRLGAHDDLGHDLTSFRISPTRPRALTRQRASQDTNDHICRRWTVREAHETASKYQLIQNVES